jgi:hypothetical protein
MPIISKTLVSTVSFWGMSGLSMMAFNLLNYRCVSSCAIAGLAIPQKMSEPNKINNAAGVEGLRIDVPA